MTDTKWYDEVDVSELHEPTVRAVIDTMRRTGAPGAAYVLEAQYRNDQIGIEGSAEARRLRQLADFVETHPTVNLGLPGGEGQSAIDIYVENTVWDSDFNMVEVDVKREMARLRRTIGGTWEKNATESYFEITGMIGDSRVRIWSSRNAACERVVVGTETKMVKDYASAPEIEQEVEIVEWKCPEVLG